MDVKNLETLLVMATNQIEDLKKKLNEYDTKKSTPFHEFFSKWLEHKKNIVEVNTWNEYYIQANKHIIPYFIENPVFIENLQPKHIQDYYDEKLKTLSKNTIRHHHASIHDCLNYAIIQGLVEFNVATRIKLPAKEPFISDYYTSEELKTCIKLFKNDTLQPAIILAGLLGLRRSEVLGLTWDCINFKNNTLNINNVIIKTICYKTGKQLTLEKPRTKTAKSHRNFVIPDFLLFYLSELKKMQLKKFNKLKYICINQDGELFKPDYISKHFKLILKKNKFKTIRFHDLRHSCATILHDNDISLKDIQEFLGHTNISTTANIYTHFNEKNKIKISNSLEKLFNDM